MTPQLTSEYDEIQTKVLTNYQAYSGHTTSLKDKSSKNISIRFLEWV